MFRSAFLILSGNSAASLMGFARNLLVARMLGVEDYGIAVTFALSTALVEMASTIGLQKLIVQAHEGDEPSWQASLQGFHLLRGLLAALALFVLAEPISEFFGIPDLAWAYRTLALVPLFLGFEHFDIHRLTRHGIYLPIVMYRVFPLVVSISAVWPLLWLFGDYRVMLYALLIQWLLAAVVSHFASERRYQLRLDRKVLSHAFSFGWPLLVNNALLFAVMEGDRIIVGRELGLELLALFSLGLTITRMPIGVIAQSVSIFFLPRLSAVQGDSTRFCYLASAVMQVSLCASLVLVLLVGLFGGPIVILLLGEKYVSLAPYLVWFAIWQAVRGARSGVSQIALALGDTRQIMFANIVRLVALPLVWVAAANGGSLNAIIAIAAGGEAAAFVVSFLFLKFKSALDISAMVLHTLAALFFLAFVACFYVLFEDAGTFGGWQWLRVVMIAPFIIVILSMKEILQPIRAYVSKFSNFR